MSRTPQKAFLRLALLALSLTSAGLAAEPAQTGPYHDLVIPLAPPTPIVTAAQAQVQHLLARYTASEPRPVTELTRGRQAILYGDLFRTGENYALLQLRLPPVPPDDCPTELTALALRQDGRWQLRGLWDILPIWRPPGWKSDSEDYLPVTPATSAFHLVDLSDARSPEVLVAGEVDRYFQRFYLFRFSPENKTLRLVQTSMVPPERLGPYVRLYEKSPRRAIWSESIFCRWKGSTLSEVASWHDEVPYNESEGPPFIEVEVFSRSGQSQSFRIQDANIASSEDNQSAYEITRDGQPYATVTFSWNPKHKVPPGLPRVIEEAWLFQRLTRLSLACFPVPDWVSEEHASTPGELKTLLDLKRYGTVQFINAPAPLLLHRPRFALPRDD